MALLRCALHDGDALFRTFFFFKDVKVYISSNPKLCLADMYLVLAVAAAALCFAAGACNYTGVTLSGSITGC